MDFDKISIKAYNEEELDDYSTLAERYAYMQLKELYERYRYNDFSKEQARQIKNKIKKQYMQDLSEEKMIKKIFEEHNKKTIENETLLYQLMKSSKKDEVIDISLKIISNCLNNDMIKHKNLQDLQ